MVFMAKQITKAQKVILKAGDMLVYKGMILEHWREAFIGQDCGKVFLHYNDVNSKDADKNIYDGGTSRFTSYFKGFKL